MDKILHYLKEPKLWELWYIPYNGSCRILSINRTWPFLATFRSEAVGKQVSTWVVVKIRVTFGVPDIVRHLLFRVPKKGP